jgi:uncharacterized protein YcaQ
VRTISATTARRLAITRQRLAGPASEPTADGILEVARDLGFLQLDPTSGVAPSHQLVVFSRVGPYQPKHLETLLWDERRLFESWAHAASILVTEHFPIYRWIMRRVATGTGYWDGFTLDGAAGAARPRMDEGQLPTALSSLEKQGRIVPVSVNDANRSWPGVWYVHADDLALLDRIEAGAWIPRTALLSPFDNLISDRTRSRRLFGFDYAMEIYVPAAKRRFGYYAMPVLHEDRLVARVDPAMNREAGRLSIRKVSVEAGCDDTQTARATREAIAGLATF